MHIQPIISVCVRIPFVCVKRWAQIVHNVTSNVYTSLILGKRLHVSPMIHFPLRIPSHLVYKVGFHIKNTDIKLHQTVQLHYITLYYITLHYITLQLLAFVTMAKTLPILA